MAAFHAPLISHPRQFAMPQRKDLLSGKRERPQKELLQELGAA